MWFAQPKLWSRPGYEVMMGGTLALVGSGEYLPPMERVDRWLRALLPDAPRVACLPTAAGMEGRARIQYWMDLGVNHFGRLGAAVEAVRVTDRASAEDAECAARVRAANFVYLSGGKPTYLYDTLAGTPVWSAILEILAQGGVLAGCSAGAMICGARAVPWGRHPGFNLLPGAVIMPHYDELPRRFAHLLKVWLARRGTLVGIDGNTALVMSDGAEGGPARLQVLGAGGVTVWASRGPMRYGDGQAVPWG
jgi:cyanophycinase